MANYPEYQGYPWDPDFGNPAGPDLSNPIKITKFEQFRKSVGGGTTTTGGGQSPEQIVNDIMKTQQAKIDEEAKFLQQYTVDNPFAFDEALAKESSTAEYTPYYSELLEDYLKGVDLQKTTIQDTRKLQGELNKLDIGERTRSYQRAVNQAEEGFTGQGMFFSGIKKRALGQGEVEQKAGMERLATTYGAQETGLQRRETALGLEQTQKERDVARAKQEAITGGIETRRGEAMTQYYVPFTQSYKRQYPTGTMGVEGYLPESFLQYRY